MITMSGVLGGYVVEAQSGDDRYRITLENGVRGINIPVNVAVIDDVWSVTLNGQKLKVKEVIKYSICLQSS